MLRAMLPAACGFAFLTFAASGLAAPGAPSQAPVAIPMVAGRWVFREGPQTPSRFTRRPVLAYQAEAFPRLTIDLLKLECSMAGSQRIEVAGLLPAQSFPQPRVGLAVGSLSWLNIPNAEYHPYSQPEVTRPPANLPLDDNLKGKNLDWPGHPAYADLVFYQKAVPQMLTALRSGAPIRIEFEGQRRLFPAIPADLAARYAETCAQTVPPTFTAQ